ncbi:unnamed protein product [Callosobruchus maculatus]|uniref:Uncharacterized protein n=1 Tax=Callosobruchus maculatus TaxID=64391 RepID=A0A653DE28_CALMS|nr:unnamed protein product [Callosobruchus maculatus]
MHLWEILIANRLQFLYTRNGVIVSIQPLPNL